jgi:transposase
MIKVDKIEAIRRAYFIEGKSIREISRELNHCRRTVRKALQDPGPREYKPKSWRKKPVLGPYRERIDALLDESERQPRKQRFTARRIYQLIRAEGYRGSESTVRRYVGKKRELMRQSQAYLPLEFDPGQDAQMDWTEAVVEMRGKRQKVQLFIMRLNYSRARFAMAFPFQKQEAFLEGHEKAFRFFGGVPRRIAYDNLKTAVYRILSGRNRTEQEVFITFRSYYLFESRYCTPGEAHEKGGVESDAGYALRNFMAPLPRVNNYTELNEHLLSTCLEDMDRRPRGQKNTVAELLEEERSLLLPVPEQDYPACTSQSAKVSPYSLVQLDTNRYSVPTEYSKRQVVVRAYPFRIEVLWLDQVIASHERCFDREQDIIDPLHYIGLLSQRPGAFEHAIPMRRWRKTWPPVYEQLLEALQEHWPEGRGLREFIAILKLHRDHSNGQMEKAIRTALNCGIPHLDGVELCLRQQQSPSMVIKPLDLQRHPALQEIGKQSVDLHQYERLLEAS